MLTVPLVTTVDSGEDCWCKTVPALGNVRDEAKKEVSHCTRLLSSGQQQQQNDCNMNSQVGRRRERESQARTRRQNKQSVALWPSNEWANKCYAVLMVVVVVGQAVNNENK